MRRRVPDVLVVGIYLLLAGWTTWSWWTPLGGRLTGVNGPDAVLFSWLLTWTPHALGTGQVPLASTALNAPAGINLMWNNGMALPALLLAPVTAIAGGLATVTVLTALGLAGSATAAFAALRAWGARTLPAALGGGLFGFSPAIVAQSLGHPDLVFDVLTPVIVLLAMRLVVTERERWRTAVLLGLAAGAQVLIGEEVLVLTAVTVVLLTLVLALSHPRDAVRRAPVVLARAGVALGVFALVAGGPLAFQLLGPLRQTGSPFTVAYYGVDLANLVVATPLQLFARGPDRTTAYPGGLEEHTGYLGWPLLVVTVLALVLFARRERVRVPLIGALVTGVFSLGEELTIGGERTGVTLPWAWLSWLPGFEHVIADRFALLTAGLLGVGLAFALDELRDADRFVRVAATAAVAITLVPLLPTRLPGADAPRVPAFFTTAAAAACPGGSVLVLPFPAPDQTDPMAWQAASGMAFAMPGGYFIGPADDGHAYVAGQPTRTGTLLRDVLADGQVRPVTAAMRAAFDDDVRRWRACAAVLGPTHNLDALREQATALIGHSPAYTDGVLIWRGLPG